MVFNIYSLILGLGAWCFACVAIAGKEVKKAYSFSIVSFSLCVISVVLQLFEIGNRASVGDFAGIDDTIGAVLFASVVLGMVTIVLNVVALVKQCKE